MGGEAELSGGDVFVGASGGNNGAMPSDETGEDTGAGDASGGRVVNPES